MAGRRSVTWFTPSLYITLCLTYRTLDDHFSHCAIRKGRMCVYPSLVLVESIAERRINLLNSLESFLEQLVHCFRLFSL